MKNIILNTIALFLFVSSFIIILRFLEVDNCLDAGGTIDYTKGICMNYRESEYSSLLWKNNILLWILICTLSIIPALIVRYIGKKYLPMSNS